MGRSAPLFAFTWKTLTVPDRWFAAKSSVPSGEKAMCRGKSPRTGTVSSSRSRAPSASTA